MSVGNLKDQGNKGNNFPYQLRALQLASISKWENLHETTVSATSPGDLGTILEGLFAGKPHYYLVSKNIVWDGTNYTAFITYAVL